MVHLIIEVALKVAAAAAEPKHGAHIGQQLPQSRQEVLIKPCDVRMAQLLPVQATGQCASQHCNHVTDMMTEETAHFQGHRFEKTCTWVFRA